jgi:predicted Rdx family selenoprotein
LLYCQGQICEKERDGGGRERERQRARERERDLGEPEREICNESSKGTRQEA